MPRSIDGTILHRWFRRSTSQGPKCSRALRREISDMLVRREVNPMEARHKRLVSGSGSRDIDFIGHAFVCNPMDACRDFAPNKNAML